MTDTVAFENPGYGNQQVHVSILYGGGFFLTCKDLGGRFDNSFPACAFFFQEEIGSPPPIPLFKSGAVHSG